MHEISVSPSEQSTVRKNFAEISVKMTMLHAKNLTRVLVVLGLTYFELQQITTASSDIMIHILYVLTVLLLSQQERYSCTEH